MRDYRPAGYATGDPMVPHGQSVSLTAPAAFRFTYESSPARHDEAARLIWGDAVPAGAQGVEALPDAIVALCRDAGIPNGIGAFGFGDADLDGLVDGAMKQERLLAISPRSFTAHDIRDIFRTSIRNW